MQYGVTKCCGGGGNSSTHGLGRGLDESKPKWLPSS